MEELIVSRFFSELSKAPKRGNGNFGGGSFSPPSHLPEKLPCCSQQPRNQDGAEEPGDGPNEEAGSQAERLPGLSPQSSASGPQGSMTPSNARNPACSERRGGTRRALRTRPWWRWGACRVCPPLTHSWGGVSLPPFLSDMAPQGSQPPPLLRLRGEVQMYTFQGWALCSGWSGPDPCLPLPSGSLGMFRLECGSPTHVQAPLCDCAGSALNKDVPHQGLISHPRSPQRAVCLGGPASTRGDVILTKPGAHGAAS